MSHHTIDAIDVHFTYPDGTVGLAGVSFHIGHGESVALVGANGAGKSTLLMHLNGCLTSTSGELRIGGFPVNDRNLKVIRRTVGMVFQDPDDQLFMPTVFDDVAFGPVNLGLPMEEVERKVMHALETVGIPHLAKKPPYRLSGGEKRAASLATVLSMSPDILVMDEPSSSLDPAARRRLIELLKTFHHTKIIATHDLDLALDLCRRTLVLHKGKILADGPTADIFMNDALLAESCLEKPLGMQGCPRCGGRTEAE